MLFSLLFSALRVAALSH